MGDLQLMPRQLLGHLSSLHRWISLTYIVLLNLLLVGCFAVRSDCVCFASCGIFLW